MPFDFLDKVVLVTGAVRGIGKNIAMKFAEAGAIVIVADISKKSAGTMIKEARGCRNSVEYFYVDLSKTNQAENMVTYLFEKYGHIDVLVNNARAGQQTTPLEETEANWQLAVDVSLKSPLFLSQALINNLGAGSRGANIVNISSVTASTITQESAVYHLTKAALDNLTRYLAVFGGPKGVRVNSIRPGFIVQDEHWEKYKSKENSSYRIKAEFCHPLKRVGTADEIAYTSLFLASEYASYITGQIITVDGGLTLQGQWDIVHRYSNIQ